MKGRSWDLGESQKDAGILCEGTCALGKTRQRPSGAQVASTEVLEPSGRLDRALGGLRKDREVLTRA